MSFRAATNTLERLKEQLRRLLQLPQQQQQPGLAGDSNKAAAAREMSRAIDTYMRRASETFDLTKHIVTRRILVWCQNMCISNDL